MEIEFVKGIQSRALVALGRLHERDRGQRSTHGVLPEAARVAGMALAADRIADKLHVGTDVAVGSGKSKARIFRDGWTLGRLRWSRTRRLRMPAANHDRRDHGKNAHRNESGLPERNV